ncbi:SusC/RagA family TonB-linked outer membrane protein [Chishuiella changwenlii]|uniref:SusC/RagA family TonB-linked outer membrane protein n=1 Tax=Chishuiella changwenlii TaxID=1434701 RepID=UPI002FDB06E8
MKRYLTLLSLCFASLQLMAQEKSKIKGIVQDEDGKAVAGAQVLVIAETNGKTSYSTQTNADGTFVVEGLFSNQTYDIEIEHLNYKSYFLDAYSINSGDNNSILVKLDSNIDLEGVVVTALGIKREEKKLGYAQQTIDSESLNTTENNNWSSGLKGKVAGLNIVSAGSGPINSQNIILRGNSSTEMEKNYALIVIDGIPMNPEFTSSGNDSSYMGADSPIDFGNALSDLNPNDIESVSVLKGPAAAALYGSRASGGALMITTKSGKKSQKVGVDFRSSVSVDYINRWPDYQYEYGQGSLQKNKNGDFYYSYGTTTDGNSTSATSSAFGPKFDGQYYYQYDPTVQGRGAEKTLWRPYKDNRKAFWDTGVTYTNNVTVSGGSDKGSIRASIGNVNNSWIMPNTGFNSNTASINSRYQISDAIKLTSVVNYVNKTSDNLPGTGYNNGSIGYFMIFQNPNVDLDWYKPGWRKGEELTSQIQPYSSYIDNPFIIANEATNPFKSNQITGNLQADIRLNSKLSLMVRSGLNMFNQLREQRRPHDMNRWLNGHYKRQDIQKKEMNSDFLFTYNDKIGDDFTITANLGGNRMNYEYYRVDTQVDALVTPGVYKISNGTNSPIVKTFDRFKKVNSIYGMLSFGFRDQIFIDITSRNDWSSTLPKENRSYFYPSVSSSFILSDIFKMAKPINYLKYRLAYAMVGNDTDPYRTSKYYASNDFPGSSTTPTQLHNINLKPEITRSWETGFELLMFKKRFGLDFTVYQTNTENQIIVVPTDPTSGYTRAVVNGGEVRNRGIEIMMNVKPIKTEDFQWEMIANWYKNENEILSLTDGVDEKVLATSGTVSVIGKIGGSTTAIYGYGFLRDPQGNIIYENGIPAYPSEIEYIGDATPKWRAGLTNNFRYKNLSLSVTFDGQYGGIVYSQSYHKMMEQGKLKDTLPGRETGYIVGQGVVKNTDGSYSPNTEQVLVTDYYAKYYRRANVESNSFDASYIKLREISLTYNLPKKFINKTGLENLSFSIYGRDLAVWSDFPLYDPETASIEGSSLIPGVEMGQMPSTASVGFTLKASL